MLSLQRQRVISGSLITKAWLRALAERQQLSESALLKRLVELVLLKAGLSPIITETPAVARPLRPARLMIRLQTDDQILLRDRAAARGMAPTTYVSVLTRAHLRSLALLPKEELLALKRTLADFGSIGRNLNQIARAANQSQLVTSPGRDDLAAMLRICLTLRDNLKRVLLANLKSWELGFDVDQVMRATAKAMEHQPEPKVGASVLELTDPKSG